MDGGLCQRCITSCYKTSQVKMEDSNTSIISLTNSQESQHSWVRLQLASSRKNLSASKGNVKQERNMEAHARCCKNMDDRQSNNIQPLSADAHAKHRKDMIENEYNIIQQTHVQTHAGLYEDINENEHNNILTCKYRSSY